MAARKPNERRGGETLRAALAAWTVPLVALGCGTESTPTPPAPVAGLQHAEIAVAGSEVFFSAANTAVAAAGDAPTPGTQIVRFDFTVADGSPLQSTAAPSLRHTFSSPGTFAVQLRVVDDLGRSSEVSSSIRITEGLGTTCAAGDVALCDSARCQDGACLALACAGAEACPADLVCDAARCVLPERASSAGGTRYGADGTRTALDAAP
ncbi:MAG: PKD domain-containing protein [Deltaproteobacteria bacterium]|nr:PKD domain-containing protein [Deltaproteobacteria bacterium]